MSGGRGRHAHGRARDFITSVPRTVAGSSELLRRARGHWSIENRPHYVRDVTLGEDASRIRKHSGPEVRGAIRNATIGFTRSTGVTTNAEALRRNAARVDDLFAKLGNFKQ